MKFLKLFNIYVLQLFLINFYVLIGLLPFFIFVLGAIPTLIKGITFEKCTISDITLNMNENGGRHNSTCYLYVDYTSRNGITYTSSELCENFEFDGHTDNYVDVGKVALVRIDHGSELERSVFQRHHLGQGFFNSVISIDGRKINSKYLPNNFTWTFFFLLGSAMFICWLMYSLIPRIKGTHPLQIALKNLPPKPKEKFNYDKY